MSRRSRPEEPPIFARPLTENTELRPLEVRHADEFAAHLDRAREHIRPWVGPAFVTETVDEARGTLARYAATAAEDGARLYGIWADGRLVGGVMYVSFDAHGGSCEIGCWLEPAAEGRGLVTPACRVLVDWALGDRGLVRAEWRGRTDNVRSAAVAERLGMTLEGVLRRAWLNGGVHHDKQVWAVVAGDWDRPAEDHGGRGAVQRRAVSRFRTSAVPGPENVRDLPGAPTSRRSRAGR